MVLYLCKVLPTRPSTTKPLFGGRGTVVGWRQPFFLNYKVKSVGCKLCKSHSYSRDSHAGEYSLYEEPLPRYFQVMVWKSINVQLFRLMVGPFAASLYRNPEGYDLGGTHL